jgi:hypothetical protein
MSPPRWRPAPTLPGFAALGILLVLLIRSLPARNAYEIVLAAGGLVLWLALGAAGAWASRRMAALEPLWKTPLPLFAGGGETVVTGLGFPVPLFFRLHFLVRGRFYPQGGLKGCAVFAGTSVRRGADRGAFVLEFPLGGLFRAEGFCRLRDVFGLFSFPCGVPRMQTLAVRNGPCLTRDFQVKALSGAEDRRNKNASDEERYYMREYAPGDRFRDINWKSSERVDALITRISPDNQEKVSRIEVCFRNFGPVEKPSLGDLWLLDRAKARLVRFLRSVKDEQASYIFTVHCAQGDRELRDQDELEAFFEELAALPFAAPRREDFPAPGPAGELYVFSTACDAGLPAFLLARQGRPLSLFLVRSPEPGRGGPELPRELLRLRDFPARGLVPPPRWILPSPARRIAAGGVPAEFDYAEARW